MKILEIEKIFNLCEIHKLSLIGKITAQISYSNSLFEYETCLDKKQIWELDSESLLIFGSKVSNNSWKEILEYWAGYKQQAVSETDPRTYAIWGANFNINSNILQYIQELIRGRLIYI